VYSKEGKNVVGKNRGKKNSIEEGYQNTKQKKPTESRTRVKDGGNRPQQLNEEGQISRWT